MGPKVLNQLLAYLCIHAGWLCLVLIATRMWLTILLELFAAVNRAAFYTQEVECSLEHGRDIFVEVLTSEDEKLCAWIVLHPMLELINIDAACQVRVVAMVETGIILICDNFLMLSRQSLLLASDSFRKG